MAMSAGPSCVRLSEGSDTTTSRSADASLSGRSVDSARTAVRVDLSCVELSEGPDVSIFPSTSIDASARSTH